VSTISLPLWLAIVVGVLAAWSLLDRLLLPSVRFIVRRRVNRVLDELNTRLRIRIPPFKLTRREVLIDRLLYDPEVQAAAAGWSEREHARREVAMQRVGEYAKEIVPAFNAYVYFRIGYATARRVARFLYRVRLGGSDDDALAAIPPDSTVVFLINHRSNMDYILVAYLAAEKTALSYAVGEWARVWPLQTLVRAMGAYFVRRNSRDALYRKVLERYVAMATAGGVTQAVFPEGGLSRDGRLRPPKLGILDYMVRAFDPASARDILFVPVGINYDRVFEDRSFLLERDPEAKPPGPAGALRRTSVFVARNLWLMLRNRWYRFGYACVNFGNPISLRAYLAGRGFDFCALEPDEHSRRLQELAGSLMDAVARVIPVVPVPLVAAVLLEDPGRAWSELELKAAVLQRMRVLASRGARVYVPRRDQDYAIHVGLRTLLLRRLIEERGGIYSVRKEEIPLLEYYANSIAHL
jgi:glycerol-3-phosphate O-acyltransferase